MADDLSSHLEVRRVAAPHGEVVVVRAGQVTVERVVPPAGERFAFDRHNWPVEVQVFASPTGRGVQVWVNGDRVLSTTHKIGPMRRG